MSSNRYLASERLFNLLPADYAGELGEKDHRLQHSSGTLPAIPECCPHQSSTYITLLAAGDGIGVRRAEDGLQEVPRDDGAKRTVTGRSSSRGAISAQTFCAAAVAAPTVWRRVMERPLVCGRRAEGGRTGIGRPGSWLLARVLAQLPALEGRRDPRWHAPAPQLEATLASQRASSKVIDPTKGLRGRLLRCSRQLVRPWSALASPHPHFALPAPRCAHCCSPALPLMLSASLRQAAHGRHAPAATAQKVQGGKGDVVYNLHVPFARARLSWCPSTCRTHPAATISCDRHHAPWVLPTRSGEVCCTHAVCHYLSISHE